MNSFEKILKWLSPNKIFLIITFIGIALVMYSLFKPSQTMSQEDISVTPAMSVAETSVASTQEVHIASPTDTPLPTTTPLPTNTVVLLPTPTPILLTPIAGGNSGSATGSEQSKVHPTYTFYPTYTPYPTFTPYQTYTPFIIWVPYPAYTPYPTPDIAVVDTPTPEIVAIDTPIPDLETPAVSTAEGPIDILAKASTDFIANSINENTPSWLTGIGTSIIGLIGLFTSTLSAWRKEKREAQITDFQHEKAKLEIERKEIELERRELKFEKEKFNSEKDKK